MQLDLLDGSPPEPTCSEAKPLTIEQRFDRFHADNPHVFEEMLRLARARLTRGETFISVKALWEELRTTLKARSAEGYRLNNSFTACYGRALLEAEPALAGVIETRRRKSR